MEIIRTDVEAEVKVPNASCGQRKWPAHSRAREGSSDRTAQPRGSIVSVARTNPLSAKQKALLTLLRARSGRIVTDEEILDVTKWKPVSWRVYLNNGLYAPYLRPTAPGKYEVLLDSSVTDADFHRQATQSTARKGLVGDMRDPLSRALVARSADNMMLALETFNRPSLRNRLDGFAILFCTAWEQLLKAEMIERGNAASVYRPQKPGRRRETINLNECLDALLPDRNDLVRLNVEKIAEIRHEATHFIVPEIQAPFAYLFQAGVVNYAKRFRDVTGAPFLSRSNIGLLAVAGQGERIDAAALAHLYGDQLGPEIAQYASTLEEEIEKVADERFAVRVEITMRFATKKESADVTLAQATEAPVHAVVLEKPVDPERTHPHRTNQLLARVQAELGDAFSSHDLRCVIAKEKWKKSDNAFYRLQQNPDTPKYSEKAGEEIVRLVRADPDYLKRARESYARASKRR